MGATKTVTLQIVGDSSSASKALSGVATQGEQTSGRISGAFKNLAGELSSSGIFGPLGDALSSVSGMLDQVADHAKTVGAGMQVVGAGLTGIGLMGATLGSKDQQAQQQLAQAISNTGHAYSDYSGQIDQAVSKQAKFGNTANETMNALQTLTQSTNDPAKALQYLGTAADLAAAKHESLTSAASTLATILSGKGTKALAQFGIALGQTAVTGKTVTSATNAATAADAAAAKAKEKLIELEQEDAQKKTLTLSEQFALKNAQDAVTAADAKASAAHEKLSADQQTLANSGLQGAAAVDELAKKVGGQAAAAADTFTGHLKALRAEIENGASELGQKYGPALTGIGAGISVVGTLTETGTGLLQKMGLAQGTLTDEQRAAAAAQDTLTASQEAGAAATEALTGAEVAEEAPEAATLGPLLLLIAAVAALGIGAYELVTHWKTVWDTIKQAVSDAFGAIEDVVSGAIDWVTGHWQLLLAILTGPFGLAVLWLKDHWHEVSDDIGAVIDWVKDNWPLLLAILTGPFGLAVLFISDHINDIINFITGIPGAIATVGEAIAKTLADGVIAGLNFLIDGWNDVARALSFKLPGWIPVIGGDSFSLPTISDISYMASGGIVSSPTLAVIGEAGPEAVVPLPSGGVGGGTAGGGGGSSDTLEITNVITMDGRVLAQQMNRYIRNELIKSGRQTSTIFSGVQVRP
jgi:hypothetical protein